MKELEIYNTLKQRLETVHFEFTPDNTTWFDDCEDDRVYCIADAFGGLLIQKNAYVYPVLIENVSRSDIGRNQKKVLRLLRQLE